MISYILVCKHRQPKSKVDTSTAMSLCQFTPLLILQKRVYCALKNWLYCALKNSYTDFPRYQNRQKFYHKEEKLCLIRTCLYLDQKYPSLVIVCYCLNSYHETLEVIHLQDRLEAKSNHPQTNWRSLPSKTWVSLVLRLSVLSSSHEKTKIFQGKKDDFLFKRPWSSKDRDSTFP